MNNCRKWICSLILAPLLITGYGCSDGSDGSNEGDERPIDMTELTATEAVSLMKAGEFTPSQYAETLLERAEQLEHLNAFIYLNPDEVRTAAAEATRKLQSGEPVGKLIGIPLLVKDSVDTAGIPTTGGTPSLVNNVPMHNAPFLQKLLDEDAYVFGKTNLAEFSMDPLGSNDFYGIALNPYDTTRITGGTSSGTGVAVSARIGPFGVGEDTTGSIRIPASFMGIVGFRATPGRYSNSGIVPLAPHRDTPGPMVRSMDDAILMDSVATGSPIDFPAAELEGLRLGIQPAYWAALNTSVDAVGRVVLEKLEAQGVILVTQDIPDLRDLVAENFLSDQFCATFDAVNNYLTEHELGFDYYHVVENIVTPTIKLLMNLTSPGFVPQEECDYALNERRPQVQALFEGHFNEHELEALLLPTVPFAPPPVGTQTVIINGEEGSATSWALRNTEPAAFAGLPSLNIPIGLTEDEGLPVGLLIEGPAGSDRRVLAIGKAIEALLPPMPAPVVE